MASTTGVKEAVGEQNASSFSPQPRKTRARRYRKVAVEIWSDALVSSMSDMGQLAFLYLLTHPLMTSAGFIRVGLEQIAAERRWRINKLRHALAPAIESGALVVDRKSNCLWFSNFLRHNPPNNVNAVKSWVSLVPMIPEGELRDRVIASMVETLAPFPRAFREPFADWLRNGCATVAATVPATVAATNAGTNAQYKGARSRGDVTTTGREKDSLPAPPADPGGVEDLDQVGELAAAAEGGDTTGQDPHTTQTSTKPLTEQQECVRQVVAIYAEQEIPPPAASLIVRWRKILHGSTQQLVDLVNRLADTGALAKGTGYVAGAVKREATDPTRQPFATTSAPGNTPPGSPAPPLAPRAVAPDNRGAHASDGHYCDGRDWIAVPAATDEYLDAHGGIPATSPWGKAYDGDYGWHDQGCECTKRDWRGRPCCPFRRVNGTTPSASPAPRAITAPTPEAEELVQ
jgi:hypothetical protein